MCSYTHYIYHIPMNESLPEDYSSYDPDTTTLQPPFHHTMAWCMYNVRSCKTSLRLSSRKNEYTPSVIFKRDSDDNNSDTNGT